MKKSVFAIWGHEKQGKSETVKKIAKEIIKTFPMSTTFPAKINFSSDIKIIIAIEKLKIGIESQGDPNSRLFSSLESFASENCDIIVCSTRTSGATVDAVIELGSAHSYEIVWTTNYRSNEKNQSTLNDISAKQIFSLILKVMEGRI